MKARLFFQLLIVFGIAARFYGIHDPWKRHDHYNFGGIWTTSFAECVRTTPLSISKGVPHSHCWTDQPNYYRAHPPTVLFALWGWTSVFGESEAAHRLFTLTFSCLNIMLVFLIARRARPESEIFPWIAAALQSVFLGNVYFGTHLDFISEFTISFCLLMAWLALSGRMTAAAFAALAAGISAWPGYISFGPLIVYAWLQKRGVKRVLFLGAFGFCLALGTMMWLHQTVDILAFLRTKMLDPGYISEREKGWREPFLFLWNITQGWSRLLSPTLAAFAVYELARGDGRAFFRSWRGLDGFAWSVWLAGGTGVLYALIGHQYFMVHVYLYLMLTPGLALLAARFIEKAWAGDLTLARGWLTALALAFAALYPYGIFQSSLAHDVFNSLLLAGGALALIAFAWGRLRGPRTIPALVAVAALANVSQTINYRNEPDTERSFCEKARAEYERTDQTVVTREERSDAKDNLYCRGIPIEYVK